MPTIDEINAQRAKVGASQVKNPAVPTAQSFMQTPGQTFYGTSKPIDTPLPTRNSPNIVPQGYDIRTDPTYIGNMGPAAGESWSGGQARIDGTMAGGSNAQPFKTLAQRIQQAGDAAAQQPGYLEDKLRARQQAEANELAKIQMEQQAQAAAVTKANSQANQGAVTTSANTPQSFSDARLNTRLGAITGDRQAYIQKRRAEGATDRIIRDELASGAGQAPVTQPPTTPTNAPPSTTSSGTTTPPPTSTTTPTPTPTQSTTQTGTKATDKPVDPNVPTTVGPTPASVAFRNMAALAVDPLEKLLMSSFADQIDATPAGGQTMGFSDYLASADAQAVAKGYNDANSILSGYQSTVEASKNSRQKFSQDQFDRNDAYLASAKANADAQLQFANDKGARDLAESNRKNLNKMSNALAFQGGFGSAGGNAEVLDAQLKGEQAIVDLNKEYGFKRTDVSLQFTQMHNQAYDKFQESWLTAQDNFDARIADIASQKNANETAKKGAIRAAFTEKNKAITDANLAHAKAINDATKFVTEERDKLRDDKRAQEQLGWSILDDAVGRYGSLIPKSTIDRVTAMLPAGTDIRDYINTPTIAERNSKRISGAGGTGKGGSASYSLDGVTPQGLALSNLNANDLRGAVTRIFAPANYGGTASERADRIDGYMKRIARGENPASIASSLQSDYWASQKGAPRTAHDGRTEAQASSDSLQSFIDHYGIGAEEDGPLGQIDSRVEGFKSFFKQSSDEYNNLANNVGNIRARIIKENYGAAVTPQELEIAQSYIPDMTDHGAKFITKLQNLKSYNAYLDAKIFAANAGLPAPTPPVPVTLSGNKMTGAGKYSDADIDSAL